MPRPFREDLHRRDRLGRFEDMPGVVSPVQTERLRAAAEMEALRGRPIPVLAEDGCTSTSHSDASDRAVWLARQGHLADADELRYRPDGKYPSAEAARRSAALAEVLAEELRGRGHEDPDDPAIGRRPLRDGEGPLDAIAHLDSSLPAGAEPISVLDSHGQPVPVKDATSYQLYWGRQGRLAAAEALAGSRERAGERQRWEREAVEIAEELDGRGLDNPDDPALGRQVTARDANDAEVVLADATPRQLYWARQGRLWYAEELRWDHGPYDATDRIDQQMDQAREIEMELRYRGLDPDDDKLGAPEPRPGRHGPFVGAYCSLCSTSLEGFEVGEVAGHEVYKLGEWDYTELAHAECASHDPRFDWQLPEGSPRPVRA